MEKMNFEVDSALLSELGERLVGSVQVALMELVKNSYDADATEVRISIDSTADGVETIVEDNGQGMTLEQVRKYWMRIATTNKVKDNISTKYGRPKSGAKGIGRFSCRRLGSELFLATTAKLEDGKYETTQFLIDWDDFKPGTSLQQLQVECDVKLSDEGRVGTQLKIKSFNRALFTKQNLKYIKRNSVILVANRGISRPGYAKDPGFNIAFRFFGEADGKYRNLRNDLIDAGWGTVTACVDKDGSARFVLTAIDGISEGLVLEKKYPMLAGAKLRIGALVEEVNQIRDKEILTLGAMRDVLSDWGGVYVRYNGVRVEPYGGSKDDWLNVDRDRGLRRGASQHEDIVKLAKTLQGVTPNRYLLALLSSRAYVGDVEIDSSMSGFELKASREGLLNTQAFDELQEFARFAVDYITLYRENYLHQKEDSELAKANTEFTKKVSELDGGFDRHDEVDYGGSYQDVGAQAVAFIRRWAPNVSDSIPSARKKQILEGIAQAANVIEVQQKHYSAERSRLRLVASTSVLLSLFSHDVKAYLSRMGDISMDLKDMAADNPSIADKLNSMIADIEANRKAFLKLVNLTLSIAAPGRSEEEIKLSVKPHIETVLDCFRKIMVDYNVACDISNVPDVIYTGCPMRESELYSILVNIISNALKAVVAKQGTARGKIMIAADMHGTRCRLVCRDNGIGVNVENSGRLFTAYVVDPEKVLYPALGRKINSEHSLVLGNGSGLGLSIVKQIVEGHGGNVEFVSAPLNWSTEIRLEV